MADKIDFDAVKAELNATSKSNNLGLEFDTSNTNKLAQMAHKEPSASTSISKEDFERLNDPRNPLKGKGYDIVAEQNEGKRIGANALSGLGSVLSGGHVNGAGNAAPTIDYTLEIKPLKADSATEFAKDAPALKLVLSGDFDGARKAYADAHPAPDPKTSQLHPDMQNALDAYKSGKTPQVAELDQPKIQSVPYNLAPAEHGKA